MKTTPISIDRLGTLIAAYGADPAGWPEDERAGAEAALQTAPPEIAKQLAEARALDALLETIEPIAPPADLGARILSSAPAPRRRLADRFSDLVFPYGRRWPAASAFASLLVGVAAGYSTAYAESVDKEVAAVLGAAFSDDAWADDLFSMAGE